MNTHKLVSSETTPDVTKLNGDIDDEKDVLTDLVKTAHEKVIFHFVLHIQRVTLTHLSLLQDVKVLISVGGWTGSRFFSSHVATAENRTKFVKTITGLKTTYNVDGVDFEYVSFPKLHMKHS